METLQIITSVALRAEESYYITLDHVWICRQLMSLFTIDVSWTVPSYCFYGKCKTLENKKMHGAGGLSKKKEFPTRMHALSEEGGKFCFLNFNTQCHFQPLVTFGHSWLEMAPRERQTPFHFLHTSDSKQILIS